MSKLIVKLKEIMDFFFEASLATYAGNAEKITFAEFPGSKGYRYESKNGRFRYDDIYFAPTSRSGGMTIIYVRDGENWIPAWIMQYHGYETESDPAIIKCLREGLVEAYRMELFEGGRGPRRFPNFGNRESARYNEDGLRYINSSEGDFRRFSGSERIYRPNSAKEVFQHFYGGQALIDLAS